MGVIDLFAVCDALGLGWREKVRIGSDLPATLSPLSLLSGSRQEAVSSGDMCEPHCPQNIRIPRELRKIDQMIKELKRKPFV